MTKNPTKTKEMIVKGKVERPLPTVTFDIKQEEFLKLLFGIFIVILQIGTSKLMPFLAKQGGVCTYYECARNMDKV